MSKLIKIMSEESKNKVLQQYEEGLIRVEDVMEPVIEAYQKDNYCIDIIQARMIIEYLLLERRKEKEKNKELEKEYERVRNGRNFLFERIASEQMTPEQFYKSVTKVYIHKDKIREKIKELEEYKTKFNANLAIEIIDEKIQLLQELLEG